MKDSSKPRRLCRRFNTEIPSLSKPEATESRCASVPKIGVEFSTIIVVRRTDDKGQGALPT